MSLNDRAIALTVELSRVAVDAWLACSGVFAVVRVDAFLPGAREPPPHDYEACDDEAAETADGNGPDWCHCCGLLFVMGGSSWVWLWGEKAGNGV